MAAFNRLLTQSEMKWKLGLSQNDDFKSGEWVRRGLVVCRTPNMTKGRVYDLTQRGLRARKQLLESLSEKERADLLKNTHSTCSYSNPPKGIDLEKYAKVITSKKLRTPIFAILEHECRRVVDEYTGRGEDKIRRPGIKSLLKHKGIEISRSNLIDGLKEMIKIGVTEVKRDGYRKNYYGLSEDGRTIMKWLLRIELLNEG